MDIPKIFKGLDEKLAIDFNYLTSEIRHNPSKGRAREVELVEEFLRKYLPQKVGITHGEIICSNGEVSNETDIIFYDSQASPILLDANGYRILPIECVYGVMEVKSHLDKSELDDAFSKISRVKQFPKVAFEQANSPIENYFRVYDQNWTYFPTVGLIFAYDSTDLADLATHLNSIQNSKPLSQRVDSVWVSHKGGLVNWDKSVSMVIHTATKNTELRTLTSDNPLLPMIIMLQQLLLSASMAQFKMTAYLQGVTYGEIR